MAKCPGCGKNTGLLGGPCNDCAEASRARDAAAYQAEQEAARAIDAERKIVRSALASRTTTAFDLPGHRITHIFGIVRGLSVRSPTLGQGFAAGLGALGGGENSALAQMCDDARQTALERMWDHAHALGATAVIGCRYDATEISQGTTEVLCYGTAVAVEEE